MTLFLISFLSGILTVLAPCVLPLLPIIVGGSLKGGVWRPYIIAASLMISIVVFTLLIKVSTILIGVPPTFFPYFSGILVMSLGIVTIFPGIWTRVAEITGFERRSQEKLEASSAKSGAFAAVLTGLALGPVFSSCSPTYSLILATVLPVSFGLGVAYLTAYALGLGIILLLISIFGQRLIKKLKWSADPKGWFRRGLGVLFVLVGLAIVTGFDKQIESGSLSAGLFDITKLEQKILKSSLPTKSSMHDSTAQTSNNIQVSMTQWTPPLELAYDGKQDAPELAGLTSWIGSSPLTIASLKGKVVLVDFWTYSCINCQRTLPYLVEWNKKYADKWLVIIGVHAPEFAFEKNPENVQKAVKDAGILYPVALDNAYSTWNAYENQYWPAKYFIDREGKLRHSHFGEGGYAESEKLIQYLLGISSETTVQDPEKSSSRLQSPETYLGSLRAKSIVNPNYKNGTQLFTPASKLTSNQVTLGGKWTVQGEFIQGEKGSTLTMKLSAKDVYLVISGAQEGDIKVTQSGNISNRSPDLRDGLLHVTGDKMYHIASFDGFEKDVTVQLELTSQMSFHAFTFGS